MTSMPTRVVLYDEAAIAEATAMIATGQPVAMPTETVYGLAADATKANAVAQIYNVKGRPSFNPLIVHVSNELAAKNIAVFDATADALAARFWPGPLTLVVPLRRPSSIAALVTAGLDTVALRVPRHRAMQALLAATGRPLAAPSANASGRISPTRAEHVVASLGGRIPLVIDDGPTSAGLESTILGLFDGDWRLLREGPVTREDLAPFGTFDALDVVGTIVAPGQLASHYAPAKPLRIKVANPDADEWMIGFGRVRGDATLSATGDPVEAAASLFDRLHEADASARARIAVAPVSEVGIGAAINDRLRRAAVR